MAQPAPLRLAQFGRILRAAGALMRVIEQRCDRHTVEVVDERADGLLLVSRKLGQRQRQAVASGQADKVERAIIRAHALRVARRKSCGLGSTAHRSLLRQAEDGALALGQVQQRRWITGTGDSHRRVPVAAAARSGAWPCSQLNTARRLARAQLALELLLGLLQPPPQGEGPAGLGSHSKISCGWGELVKDESANGGAAEAPMIRLLLQLCQPLQQRGAARSPMAPPRRCAASASARNNAAAACVRRSSAPWATIDT